jgi:hypothetical protein
MKQERYEELVVIVADGKATKEEEEELKSYLESRPELAEELEAHIQIKSITDNWMERVKLDLLVDEQNQARQSERNIGLIFLGIGISLLYGFGIYQLLSGPETPLVVRIGIATAGTGLAILLFSLIRQRIITSKKDKYSEIIR